MHACADFSASYMAFLEATMDPRPLNDIGQMNS
jgi:hypothetical protein